MNTNQQWWNTPFFQGAEVTAIRLLIALIAFLLGVFLARAARRWFSGSRAGTRLDPGVRYSVGRLFYYIGMTLSFFVAVGVAGVDLRSMAVVAGGLGIGVGLGLQSVATNLIAGLILLFERPIRVGDRVSLGALDRDTTGQLNGYVRSIRLRSTIIQTPDDILLIVPNAEMVNRTIVNWSRGDPGMRVRLTVGVALDSDLEQVQRVLIEVANGHPDIMRDPGPTARLSGIGAYSLDFSVLVWIPDPTKYGAVESDLRLDIVRRFRASGIIIPSAPVAAAARRLETEVSGDLPRV